MLSTSKIIITLFCIIYLLVQIQTTCDSSICDCQNSTCISCLASQFYYNSNALNCKLCPPQCKTCNAKQQCLTCRDMFYLSNTNCLQCQKYCKTCTLSSCTQCINGYILISSICQKCQVSNIETCQSLMTVKTCLSGYWKNGDSCSPCRQFCNFCTSSNNCLKCQDGYRTKVSAGTYCVACDTGCRTCSDTSCSQCFWNWRLINGTCVSIKSTCSLIQNCQSCEYSNNTVKCVTCTYPFYISSNGSCVQGSSILCKYSSSQDPYQCLNQCSDLGYASSSILLTTKNINQIICLPKLWIESTVIQQVSYNALYSKKYVNAFTPLNVVSICGTQYFYSNLYSNLANTIKFTNIFQPYYKLVIYIKLLPIFKSILPNTMGFNISINMYDNATNSYSLLENFNSTNLQACQQEYLTVSSRNIKDQQVSIQFSYILTSSNYNNTQLTSTFTNGIIGIPQFLVQVYRCDSKCRICSNVKYCLECYGNLFLSSHKCVDNCDGLFQFYLPNGDYINYQSKYCLQQCLNGYYSTIHPLKNNTYICLKCPDKCQTCKSPSECLSCTSPYLLFSSNFSCITSCPNTHYSSIATLQCLPCNAPCKTCKNQTECLSCSIGYFDGSNCVGSCPQGTYSSDSIKQCLSCDSKCSSCQNTPTFCMTCNIPYKLLGTSCLDNCPSNTHYVYNYTCLPCKSPCTLCSSQTQCITCSRGFLFNKTCLTDCPTGYYKDVGNSRCNLCENSCLTCLSLSICKSCVNGTYLYNSMCLSECPLKTYISPSNVCIPCIPPCLTCFNQTSCITCSLGYLSQVAAFTCITQCQDGYYGQGSNQTCMKCSSACKTCNQEQNFCITCQQGLLLENNGCVNSCSINYFSFNNQKCRPCSYPCKTCVDISSKCITCQDPYILTGVNKCSLQCLSNQYKTNSSCQNCQFPCYSCTDIVTCTSCIHSSANQTFLLNGNCFNFCPDGMYADQLSFKCKTCIFPCLTCQNSRQCLSCVSGYLNVVKKTCEVCSSNYYPEENTKTCKLCSSALLNCQQCQSSTICKVCDTGYLLLNSTCVAQTVCQNKSGYYANVQLKKCSQCVQPCQNCLNSSYCLSCYNGYLYQGKCPFTCPSSYYSNQTSKQCLSCNTSICKTCTSAPNQCTSCFSTTIYTVYFSQNKTCISQAQCPDTYYLDNLYGYWRCLKCIPPCKSCSNASFCISCTVGVLYQGTCALSCPNKYYADSNTIIELAVCQLCSNSCLQCTQNQTNCISCSVTKLLQDNACVDQCSPTYYLNQYILECLKCQSPCLLCQTATYCKSCLNNSKILYYGQCIDQCPQGTYITNNACIVCPSSCQICSYSSLTKGPICQKCSQNLYMNSSSYGTCQTSCNSTQYPDSQTRKCYPCQVPCKQCHTATKCKNCIDNYLIYNSQCLKGEQCKQGTFLDPFQKKCLDQCYSPYYGDNLTRLCSQQCTYKRLKIPIQGNRVCAQLCPSNYYVDKEYICSICSSGQCNNLLSYEIFVKSIFNKLYVKLKFSNQVLTHLIDETNTRILITDLSTVTSARRLLVDNNLTEQYNFKITQRSSRAIWLEIDTYKTLKKVSIRINFQSYYLLSPIPSQPDIQTNIQQLNQSVLLSRFDQYTTDEQQSGKSFETYSIFLSLLLFAIIILSLIGNFLSLFYHLIDYFQILFMISFLQIDYSPQLNYFLYGFRYSHYLFFPQIFKPQQTKQYSQTPGKFGIIVPDADFLSNTGHDFLIIFVCIGIVIIVKLIDFLVSGSIKSNKVTNDPDALNNGISIKNQIEHISKQQQSEVEQQIKRAHNIIQLQILQGKHGRLAKYTKIFISRLKWNYFNDISYCLYFYIALFSYSQTYIISQAQFISNLFAAIGFIFTLVLPIFYINLLYKNSQVIQSQGVQHRVYLPFKTFYYFTIPDSSYTLYNIPIRYIRKLLIAVLLVYCSQFPQFVLGIIMMLSLLNIILTYLYKPYLLTFEVYIQVVIEGLFVCLIFCLCLMELQYLDLDTSKKLAISKIVVGLTILLTVVLIIWNMIRFVVQVIKQFFLIDYFQNYYKQVKQYSTSSHITSHRHSSNMNQKQSQIQGHEQSNVRLNQNPFSPKNDNEISSLNRRSQDQYSGLDIYLKKQNDAPPMLIKCIKNFSDQQKQNDQDQRDQNDQKDQHEQSNDEYNSDRKQRQYNKEQVTQFVQFQRKKKKQRFSDDQQQSSYNSNKQYQQHIQKQKSQGFHSSDNQNQFTMKQNKQQKIGQKRQQKRKQKKQQKQKQKRKQEKQQKIVQKNKRQVKIFQDNNQNQKDYKQNIQQQQLQDHEQGNLQDNEEQQYSEQYEVNRVQQIFNLEQNRGPNKMKTIMQVVDFEVDQSQDNNIKEQQNQILSQQNNQIIKHQQQLKQLKQLKLKQQQQFKQKQQQKQKQKQLIKNRDFKISSIFQSDY